MYRFAIRNIPNQNKHKKVNVYLVFTNEGEKTEKKDFKKPKNSQNTSCVDGCYGNVNHCRHVIDTEKFSLVNFRKIHEIW